MRVCAKEIEKVRDDERREEERKRKERGVEEGSDDNAHYHVSLGHRILLLSEERNQSGEDKYPVSRHT